MAVVPFPQCPAHAHAGAPRRPEPLLLSAVESAGKLPSEMTDGRIDAKEFCVCGANFSFPRTLLLRRRFLA